MNIITEIQQQIVQALGPLNTQTQNIHDVLIASFQQLTSQHDAVMRSLQAVDRRLEEHDIYIKQGQSFHELLNASFQEIKNQHDTVNKSFQAVDRRLLEQSQSIHDRLNESFQEMKSQQGNVITNLRDVDRSSQAHNICAKHISGIHELLNESSKEMKIQHDTVMTMLQAVDRRSQEHNICINQSQSFHELLNASLQEMKYQHVTIDKSFQAVERHLLEQGQSIHVILNESFQEMKSLQAVDRRSYEQDVCINQVRSIYEFLNDIKNQTEKSRRLFNDTCDPVLYNALRDCSDIKASGYTANGVYEVCAGNQSNRLCANAYCDVKNSTSLVFQRRKDGSVNFNRTWAEYRDGFGNPDGEFWLGNEMLHLLTSKRNYKLRVDLEDWEGEKRYAEYSTFSVSSSADNYTLTVGGYSGDAGDSMSYNNGRQFSTIDADNDYYRGSNCAGRLGGAWWYGGCSLANLNGIYYNRNDTVIEHDGGIYWRYWKYRYNYSLKAAEMKLVPVA